MSDRQRTIEKAMAGLEKKAGPWPAFQKAIKSKAAVANNTLDLGVAMVMADAHENGVPVNVQIKFKGLDDGKVYGTAETEAHVSKLDSNEMRIGVALPNSIQVPQDTLVTIKMQSPNFNTVQRPSMLFETAANAKSENSGVVFAEGVPHTLTAALYNTAKYDEHHVSGLPVSDAHFNVVCAGKRGFHVQDVQISSTMNVPETPTPVRNGISESVGTEAGYEGYYNARSLTPTDMIGGNMEFAKDKDRHSKVQEKFVEALGIAFPNVPIEKFDVVTSTSTKTGTPSHTSVSVASKVDKHILLGHSGWTIISLTLLSLLDRLQKEGKIADNMLNLDSPTFAASLLGGESNPVVKALVSIYKRFAEAEGLPTTSDKDVGKGIPTITSLLTHTTGLPASISAKEDDQADAEKALLEALTVHIDELGEKVGEEEGEDEKEESVLDELEGEFSELLLSRVSYVNVPGTAVLPRGSEIESAIVGLMLLRIQKLLGKEVTVPEDCVNSFVQETLNGKVACWHPFLAPDKKTQLAEGDLGALEDLATGAVMEMRDIIRIPCYMLRKTNDNPFEVQNTFSPEIPMMNVTSGKKDKEGLERLSAVKGWTKIDTVIFGRPCPIYVSQGGDGVVNALLLYFVPKFDLCGAVNITDPNFVADSRNVAKLSSLLEPVIHCSVVGDLRSILTGDKKIETQAEWQDVRRPARTADFHLVKTVKGVRSVTGKKQDAPFSFEGTTKVFYHHTANKKTGKTKLITVVRHNHGFYQVASGAPMSSDVAASSSESAAAVEPQYFDKQLVYDRRTGNMHVVDAATGLFVDHAQFSKNGLVIGNEYYSANEKLERHDEIKKAIEDLGNFHSKKSVEEVVLGAAMGSQSGTPSALVGATVVTFDKPVDYTRVHLDEDHKEEDSELIGARGGGRVGGRGGGSVRFGGRSGGTPRIGRVTPRTYRPTPYFRSGPYRSYNYPRSGIPVRGSRYYYPRGSGYYPRRRWIAPLAILGTLGLIALGAGYPGYYHRRGYYGCWRYDRYTGQPFRVPCPDEYAVPSDYYGP